MHLATGSRVFAGDAVGVEFLTDEFEFKAELFGEFKNHEFASKNRHVGCIAVGVGVFLLDMNVGLGKGDVFVSTRGEVVGMIDVAGINHAGAF